MYLLTSKLWMVGNQYAPCCYIQCRWNHVQLRIPTANGCQAPSSSPGEKPQANVVCKRKHKRRGAGQWVLRPSNEETLYRKYWTTYCIETETAKYQDQRRHQGREEGFDESWVNWQPQLAVRCKGTVSVRDVARVTSCYSSLEMSRAVRRKVAVLTGGMSRIA